MKTYKVAVCLSGELRTWDYCKQSIKDFFEKGYIPPGYQEIQVDYFCHTWDNNRTYVNQRLTSERGHRTPKEPVSEEQYLAMVDFFQPKKSMQEEKPNRSNDAGIFLDLFESFSKSIFLKQQHELEQGFEYNIVIKCRYDLVFSCATEPALTMKYPHHLFENSVYNDSSMEFEEELFRLNIQDIFFFGTSFTMDRLASIYPWQLLRNGHHLRNLKDKILNRSAINLIDYDPADKFVGPGVSMGDYMHRHHINNRPSEYVPWHYPNGSTYYTIVRPFCTVYDVADPHERHKMQVTQGKVHHVGFKNPAAIIFDLDGVLVNTNVVHQQALAGAVYDKTGLEVFADDIISPQNPLRTLEKMNLLKEKYDIDEGLINEIGVRKQELFLEMLNSVEVQDNVKETLSWLTDKNVPLAIASNSRKENILLVLEKTGIEKYFTCIVSGYEVHRPKPHPDIMWRVYELLDLSIPQMYKTLFIEDTNEGAKAGLSSPSTVIKIDDPNDLSVVLFEKWFK